MNTKIIWVIIVLLVAAVIITAIMGHQKPDINPVPTDDIDVSPTPPSPDPTSEIDIKPDPTSVIVITEPTEEEKSVIFNTKAEEFAKNLTADDPDNQMEIQIDPSNRSFIITYNLSDEDVREFAVAMANNASLTYNDMIADMIDEETIKELKTEMYCEHLIICLKNDGQVFAAYDIIQNVECPDLIERVG